MLTDASRRPQLDAVPGGRRPADPDPSPAPEQRRHPHPAGLHPPGHRSTGNDAPLNQLVSAAKGTLVPRGRERQNPRVRDWPLTWGFGWSRLSESNRRPSHYECRDDRPQSVKVEGAERQWSIDRPSPSIFVHALVSRAVSSCSKSLPYGGASSGCYSWRTCRSRVERHRGCWPRPGRASRRTRP
jgi:hypothetical protein